jgi:hypothetical protein
MMFEPHEEAGSNHRHADRAAELLLGGKDAAGAARW